MRSRQTRSPNHQNQILPVPTTIWHQLAPTSQQQLAHLVAELIRRVRQAAPDKERDHER